MNNRVTYIYNPWLLKHIYSHLLFLHELVTVWHWYNTKDELVNNNTTTGGGEEEAYNKKKVIITENLYAEYVIYEINLLNQEINKDEFPIDMTDMNYEWLLYRSIILFRPNCIKNYPNYLHIGGTTNCETKIGIFLETLKNEDDRVCIYNLLQNYIEKCYIKEISKYKETIEKKYRILFNMKHTMEKFYKTRRDKDYIIVYSRELVMTMMYQFLIEELIGEQKYYILHTLTYSKESNHSLEAKALLTILEELLDMIKRQCKDEFDGYGVMASPSSDFEKYRQWSRKQNDHNNLCINPVPIISVVVLKTHQIVITEEETTNYRYIRLKNNNHYYITIARRFLFDCHLIRNHVLNACQMKKEKDNQNFALKYAKHCSICHYLGQSQLFSDFYRECEYIYSKIEEQDQLNNFFSTLLIPKMEAVHGLFYLTLYNTSMLFKMFHFRLPSKLYCQIIQCSHESPSKSIDFLQMIDIQGLFNHVNNELKIKNIEFEIDVAIISCHPHRVIEKETPLQHLIAVENALLSYMISGITKQETEIEKYERSLSNHLLSIDSGSSESLHRNVQMVLISTYNLYREILCDVLGVKKKY